MGSFPQPWTLPPPLSAATVALVRGIPDGPERRSARRQGVCQPFKAGWDRSRPPDAGSVQGRITLSNRDVPGVRPPSR